MLFNISIAVSLLSCIDRGPSPNGTHSVLQNCSLQRNCGLHDETSPRIIGGCEAPPHKFPWIVTIHSPNFLCGGSLITSQYVLTAAHCVIPFRPLVIGLGAHNRNNPQQEILPSAIKIHPCYRVPDYSHDIALIKLERPAILSNKVGIICLPQDENLEKPGATVTVAGWGSFHEGSGSSLVLKETTMKIVPNTCPRGCRSSYIWARGYSTGVSEGDSGSPLMARYINGKMQIIGVVSSKLTRDCIPTMSFSPSVSFFKKWIESNIPEGGYC